jgi:hypothetical protein
MMNMHIEYDATLDEIVDVCLRATERSKLAKRTRWQSTFSVAFMIGIILFLFLTLDGATRTQKLVFVGGSVVLGTGGFWLSYRHSMKKRILKHLREQLQSDAPVPFAVELREDGVWFKQGGTQVSHDWSNVVELVDDKDGVVLRMREGGFLMVRNRGFPTPESRAEFLGMARKKIQEVAAAPGPT